MKKNIIVTGGTRGIGAAIVRYLAEENNIIFCYNKSEDIANEIVQKLTAKGCNVSAVKVDLSKKEEVIKFSKYCLDKFDNIDVLINNAGISQSRLFTDISEDDWDNMINTNLNSVFYLTQAIVPNMISNKNGCIINISSIWGQIGASCESHYAVSKAGVDALTKSLAKELGPSNIRVNSIAPGIIDTDMNKYLSAEDINEIKKEIPLERIGMATDIAKCVKWLIEDNYTTGQIISINGGWNV